MHSHSSLSSNGHLEFDLLVGLIVEKLKVVSNKLVDVLNRSFDSKLREAFGLTVDLDNKRQDKKAKRKQSVKN